MYTGVAYLLTVMVLISPYLFVSNYYAALGCTILAAIVIIFGFNFYIAVAKDLDFKRRFAEMAGLSLGVAVISFGIGFALRVFADIDV